MEHLGHGGTEDVGVEQSYLVAQSGQGYRQVGCDGALAHAALARADGNDVPHLRQQFADLWAWLRLELRLYLHLHVVTAVVLDGRLGRLDGRLQERIGVARKLQHHRHLLMIDGGLVDNHLALYQIFLRASIRHRGQRIHNELGI